MVKKCPGHRQGRTDITVNFEKLMYIVILVVFFRHLGGDFSVHLGEIFNMQIRQWPETITLQVRICLSLVFSMPDFFSLIFLFVCYVHILLCHCFVFSICLKPCLQGFYDSPC